MVEIAVILGRSVIANMPVPPALPCFRIALTY